MIKTRSLFLKCTLTLLSFFALPWVAPAAAAQSTAELGKGKIFVSTRNVGGSTPEIVIRAVINASIDRVWRVVTNCNKFKGTMPRIKKARIISQSKNKMICEVTIDLPFPMSDLTAVTESTHLVKSNYRSRRWRLVRGDYKQNRGSWVLRPFKKQKNRTLVEYRVHAIPKNWAPAWLRNMAQKRSLPDMIKRIRKAVGDKG